MTRIYWLRHRRGTHFDVGCPQEQRNMILDSPFSWPSQTTTNIKAMFVPGRSSRHHRHMKACDIDALSDSTGLTWSTVPIAEPNYLSWRMDKQTSFSDWKIEIRVLNKKIQSSEPRIDLYYVHRNVLGVGDRKSGYFQELFQQRGLENSVTHLEFSERVANTMPMLLDYLYASETFEIKTENAVLLGYLAQCLSVPTLYDEVKTFIRNDLSLSNAAGYIADAVSYKDDETATRVTDVLVQELIDTCKDSQWQKKLLPSHAATGEHVKTLCVLARFPNVVVGFMKSKAPVSFPNRMWIDRVKEKAPRLPRELAATLKENVPYI